MNKELQDTVGQEPPISVRLWEENAAWFADFHRIYSSPNAAFNIALMKAQNMGDYEIEQECKKHMRVRK
jgi:hypothetical protein